MIFRFDTKRGDSHVKCGKLTVDELCGFKPLSRRGLTYTFGDQEFEFPFTINQKNDIFDKLFDSFVNEDQVSLLKRI